MPGGTAHQALAIEIAPSPDAERPLTDKLVDISPLALRMSSPFNSSYWTSFGASP